MNIPISSDAQIMIVFKRGEFIRHLSYRLGSKRIETQGKIQIDSNGCAKIN